MAEPASERLTWAVEGVFPITVVRLCGDLDGSTVTAAHNLLERCLTDQPLALVLDLGELSCAEPIWLTVFASIERRASEWPGAAVLLCCAPAVLARQLRSSGACRVPAYPTRAAANAAARRRPPPRRHRIACPPRSATPAEAREAAVAALRRWSIPDETLLAAELVVSELVTNAVRHTGRSAELMLQLDDRSRNERCVYVAVRDSSPEPPIERPPAIALTESGRGIRIIAMVASAWGVLPTLDGGKVVWATFRLLPEPGG